MGDIEMLPASETVLTRPRPPLAWPPQLLMQALQSKGIRPGQARQAVRDIGHAQRTAQLTRAQALALCSKPVMAQLADLYLDTPSLTLAERASSQDGSERLLWRTTDGQVLESVIIPSSNGRRVTVCVSSQVGCARRCAFCETGRLGLQRNLQTCEIVEQFQGSLLLWQQVRGDRPALSNVVFMGMGEPLDNWPQVVDAVNILSDTLAFGVSIRKITVSTVGVAQQLPAFFDQTRANLALSLNAPDDARRARVMPIGRGCNLAELKEKILACLPAGREILVEYILFAGFNDALADADLLGAWLQGIPSRCNLIPANPGPDPALRQPDQEQVLAFQKRLLEQGVRAMVRYPHGRDVGGACGQLAGLHRQKAG